MKTFHSRSFYWSFPSKDEFHLLSPDGPGIPVKPGSGHFHINPLFDEAGHYVMIVSDRVGGEAWFNLGYIGSPDYFQDALCKLPIEYGNFDFSSLDNSVFFSWRRQPPCAHPPGMPLIR